MAPNNAKRDGELEVDRSSSDRLPVPRIILSPGEDTPSGNHETIPRRVSGSPARHNAQQASSEPDSSRLNPSLRPARSGPRKSYTPSNSYENETMPRRASSSPARQNAQRAPWDQDHQLLNSAPRFGRSRSRTANSEDCVPVHRKYHSQTSIDPFMNGPYPNMHRRSRSSVEPNRVSHSQAPIHPVMDGPYPNLHHQSRSSFQPSRKPPSQTSIGPSMDGPFPNMHRRNRSPVESHTRSTASAIAIAFDTEEQRLITRRLKHAKGKPYMYDGDDWGDDADDWGDVGFYDEFAVWHAQAREVDRIDRRGKWGAAEGGFKAVGAIANIASLATGSG